jgi:GTP-binding protein
MKVIAQFQKGAVDSLGYPATDFPEIAFIGRSNVGKSSLINSLVNQQKLARTSNTPGRTQQINFFLINNSFYFVDLPGYGYAKLSLKQRRQLSEMIYDYFVTREPLLLTVLLLDSRHPPMELDLQAKTFLESQNRPYIVVMTKTDKLSGNALAQQIRQTKQLMGGLAVIPYSVTTNVGKEALWEVIETYLSNYRRH